MTGLKSVLVELDGYVLRYRGLRRGKKRIRNTCGLATKDLGALRAKLNFQVNLITAFTSGLSRDALARVEMVCLKLVQEVREGRREDAIISCDPRRHAAAWKGLEGELARNGVPRSFAGKYKKAIMVFLMGCFTGCIPKGFSLRETASEIEDRDEVGGGDEETSSDEDVYSDDDTQSEEDGYSDKDVDSDYDCSSEDDTDSDGEGAAFGGFSVGKMLPRLHLPSVKTVKDVSNALDFVISII